MQMQLINPGSTVEVSCPLKTLAQQAVNEGEQKVDRRHAVKEPVMNYHHHLFHEFPPPFCFKHFSGSMEKLTLLSLRQPCLCPVEQEEERRKGVNIADEYWPTSTDKPMKQRLDTKGKEKRKKAAYSTTSVISMTFGSCTAFITEECSLNLHHHDDE
eukprot:1150459-Pelagomonas_calceolata.AAC.4